MRYELQLGWRYLYAGHRQAGLMVGLALSIAAILVGLLLMWQLGGGSLIGAVLCLGGMASAAGFGLLSLLSVSSAVAVMGVSLGVWALTVVLSVTSGFQDQFKSKVLGVNAHVIVMKNSQDFAEYRDVMETARAIDPDVIAVQPFDFSEMLATTGRGRISGVAIKGVDPVLVTQVLDLKQHMIEGDLELTSLAAVPDDDHPPNIIIGKELARKLRLKVGDDVTIVAPLSNIDFETWRSKAAAPRTRRFRISGIFYSGFDEYDRRLMYTSLAQTQALKDNGDRAMGVELKVRNVDRAAAIAEKLGDQLGEPPFQVQDWYELNHNLFKALKTQKWVLGFVLNIISIVALVNLVSSMVMLVTDKTREIAILKSMGATSQSVGLAFAFCGTVIGAIGTALGIVMGVVTCVVVRGYGFRLDPKVYLIDRLPISVRISDIVTIAVVTMLLSIQATLMPSRMASRLRPVVGLRHE